MGCSKEGPEIMSPGVGRFLSSCCWPKFACVGVLVCWLGSCWDIWIVGFIVITFC